MPRQPDPLQWLEAGVPLTLLIDLVATTVPDSAAIFEVEAGDARWLRPVPHAA
jgi:hypothetical protein